MISCSVTLGLPYLHPSATRTAHFLWISRLAERRSTSHLSNCRVILCLLAISIPLPWSFTSGSAGIRLFVAVSLKSPYSIFRCRLLRYATGYPNFHQLLRRLSCRHWRKNLGSALPM